VTVPAGATVHVDGAPTGVTPLSLEIATRAPAHHVEVTLVGYEAFAQDVVLDDASDRAQLSFALRPLR
jgi:hypothetical protein